MGPGRDRTRDPWICSQTRICCQTRYRLRYAARCDLCLWVDFYVPIFILRVTKSSFLSTGPIMKAGLKLQ